MAHSEMTSVARPSRIATWCGWILGMLPVLAMVMSSSMKLSASHSAVDGFRKFGYPQHLLLVLGIVELGCALIYLIPRTAMLGAILMTGYLGGAVATHVRIGDPGFWIPTLLGVFVWLGLFLRDRRVRVLVPFRVL